MTLKAVIWDVDGTLVESEETHRAAFNRAFQEKGLGWEWDRALYAELLRVTGGKERIAHFMRTQGLEAPNTADAATFIPHLHARKTQYFEQMLRQDKVELRPGVGRLLAEIQGEGTALAIATTTSRSNVTTLLESVLAGRGLAWAAISAGDEVTHKKPAPDVYTAALGRLGFAAKECLAVEDSRNGLLSALAAGLPTIVAPSLYTQDEDFSDALAVVDHLGEPGAPCVQLSGPAMCKGYVDYEQLAAWHRLAAA